MQTEMQKTDIKTQAQSVISQVRKVIVGKDRVLLWVPLPPWCSFCGCSGCCLQLNKHVPEDVFGYIFFTYTADNSGKGGGPVKKEEKREEQKPVTWEAADPPVPVIQSGHMENRRQY